MRNQSLITEYIIKYAYIKERKIHMLRSLIARKMRMEMLYTPIILNSFLNTIVYNVKLPNDVVKGMPQTSLCEIYIHK